MPATPTPKDLVDAARRQIETKAAAPPAAAPVAEQATEPVAPETEAAPEAGGAEADGNAPDLSAQLAGLGAAAPDADPTGVFAFMADPSGWVQAWIDTAGETPVGYLRSAFDPASAVRIDDMAAWTTAVEGFGMAEESIPTAPSAEVEGADGEVESPAEPTEPADESTADPAPEVEPETKASPGMDGTGAPETAVQDDEDPGEHTGVMVALMVDEGTSADMAITGDPRATPGDALHVTLAYLGSTEDYEDEAETISKILEAIREVADRNDRIAGEISGVGRFSTPDGDAFYLSYDSPQLPALRQELMEALEGVGLEPAMDHGFSPHITLTFLEPGAEAPLPRVEPKPMTFNDITLVFGSAHIRTPLGQPLDDDREADWQRTVDGMPIPDSTAPSAQVDQKSDFRAGAWVSLADGGLGRVDLMVKGGTVPGLTDTIEGSADAPAARIAVYEEADGVWRPTGQKVGMLAQHLACAQAPTTAEEKSVAADLTAMLAEYRKTRTGSQVTPEALREVHSRGVKSWPGASVTDLDPDTWGIKRAQAFLHVAAGGTVVGYVGDRDLLPRPKVEVKVSTPAEATALPDPGAVRYTGPNPAEFAAELRRAAAEVLGRP